MGDEEDTINKNNILEKTSRFTLDNSDHFRFLRSVFEDDGDLEIFFQNLRENAIESWTIHSIEENYMSITQMILSMQYLTDVIHWPYGMNSFLNEPIKNIVQENSYKTFQSLEHPEETKVQLWDYERLLNLTVAWFSPISQYGDLLGSDQAAKPYHILHDATISWEEKEKALSICIDKSGKVYKWKERIKIFIGQYRSIIKSIELIDKTVESWNADIEYIKRLRYTYDMQWIFPEEDSPDFTPTVLEEIFHIFVEAKIELKHFCEELWKTMKSLWEDTKEYDPLKSKLLAKKERDFPIVWARIKRVK